MNFIVLIYHFDSRVVAVGARQGQLYL